MHHYKDGCHGNYAITIKAAIISGKDAETCVVAASDTDNKGDANGHHTTHDITRRFVKLGSWRSDEEGYLPSIRNAHTHFYRVK